LIVGWSSSHFEQIDAKEAAYNDGGRVLVTIDAIATWMRFVKG